MKFEFPYKGEVSIMNKGEAYGSIDSSYAIDFSTEKGRIKNSPACLTHLTGYTTGTLTKPAIGFLADESTSRFYAFADDVYRNGSGSLADPTSGWAIDTSTSTPQIDVDMADVAYFNNAMLVSGTGASGVDIHRLSGGTWSSWWKGTLAQTSLTTTGRHILGVAPNGRLYVADNVGREIYNVTPAGTVTKTGNGTLDLSDTEFHLTSMRFTSNRMWLGGKHSSLASGVVVEWDMSLNEATPNNIHYVGATNVLSICIWDDSPVLMLDDGTMRFFDGNKFYKKDGANLKKAPDGYVYRSNRVEPSILLPSSLNMHPNGSDVIDGLPHFLMAGTLKQVGTNSMADDYRYISGIFCYDPEVGLYNRHPIEGASGTHGFGSDGMSQIGALMSAPSSKTSFLASATVYYETQDWSMIFSDDKARTLATRGRFILNPFYGTAKDLWQKVEVLHKKLGNSSDRILLKYRLGKSATKPFKATITWVNSTSFTSTDTDFANAEVGDMVIVAYDQGGQCTAHISNISYANPTYTITLDEAITGISSPEVSLVRVDNFKRLATISNQKTDYHDIAVPTTEGSHTFWLMVELRASASSVVELDKIIVTSNDGK